MNTTDQTGQKPHLQIEYDIDAPPEHVWRALSEQSFRERWLPDSDIADADPVVSESGDTIAYRMREDEPPFLESVVTFHVGGNARGGTHLRIIHALTDERLHLHYQTANDNRPGLRLAA